MLKKFFCLSVALLLTTIYFLPAFSQMDMKIISSDAFEEHQRPPAVFKHDEHNEEAEIFDCSICHHVYEDGELIPGAMSIDLPCSECHKVGSDRKSPSLMKAYHKLCMGCHKKEDKGPITCGECHVKK
jgi:hypothetical protein